MYIYLGKRSSENISRVFSFNLAVVVVRVKINGFGVIREFRFRNSSEVLTAAQLNKFDVIPSKIISVGTSYLKILITGHILNDNYITFYFVGKQSVTFALKYANRLNTRNTRYY